MSKKERGSYKLSDQDLGSMEMVFIALTMLESRGYPGFMELLSIVNDPALILKIVRFMYGMQIQVPPLTEFVKCLRAAEYAFTDMHKFEIKGMPLQPQYIRKHMNLTKEQEAELLEIFDQWTIYMHNQGRDIRQFMHINRNNTKRRIEMNTKGKKWTASKW